MTAFECEAPADFLQLMMRLRETEASRYTERDTPIFVGTAQELAEMLDSLDGASARIETT
jgi:chlorite dismutase